MYYNFNFLTGISRKLSTAALAILLVASGGQGIAQGNGNGKGNGNSNSGSACMPVVGATFSANSLSVTTTSTKDLSNVVLNFCDGVHQKYDGLSGYSSTFSGSGANTGKIIQGVWIKSGCNNSGDGPGYGAYVANPNANVCNPTPPTCYGYEVVAFTQGVSSNGAAVPAARSIVANALGAPQKSDAVTTDGNHNFLALGFGGDITIKFQGAIHNGPGADFRVWETTFPNWTNNCVTYPETIIALASQDGCNWTYLGGGCQDTEFDLGSLPWAQYVRLVDVSNVASFATVGHITDGYDLDGIECLNGAEMNPVMQSSNCDFATSLVAFNQMSRKDGMPVLAERSNPLKALGAPTRVDEMNFVALGFGGSITLGFSCVIFDKPGFDIEVVETSYGTPACSNYPEKSRVEGSLDLLNWVVIGELCQDGFLDLAGKGPIQYLRITDISNSASFSNSIETDGFDVDGVIVIQPGCAASARLSATPETVVALTAKSNVYPNPFTESVTIDLTAGSVSEAVSVKVINFLGQVVHAESIQLDKETSLSKSVNMSAFAPGAYFVRIDRSNGAEMFRMIKQ